MIPIITHEEAFRLDAVRAANLHTAAALIDELIFVLSGLSQERQTVIAAIARDLRLDARLTPYAQHLSRSNFKHYKN